MSRQGICDKLETAARVVFTGYMRFKSVISSEYDGSYTINLCPKTTHPIEKRNQKSSFNAAFKEEEANDFTLAHIGKSLKARKKEIERIQRQTGRTRESMKIAQVLNAAFVVLDSNTACYCTRFGIIPKEKIILLCPAIERILEREQDIIVDHAVWENGENYWLVETLERYLNMRQGVQE